MNNQILANFWRFIGLILFQVMVLQPILLKVHPWFNVVLFPLFILLLPIALPTSASVFLGFLIGLIVDFFYGTIGIHASAGAFSGFIRAIVLALFEPKGGFSGKEPIIAPAYFGIQRFWQIAGLFFFLHLFWFFSVEQFHFRSIFNIIGRTLVGWLSTMVFVVFYIGFFRPKN
jgi:hypothetical protein